MTRLKSNPNLIKIQSQPCQNPNTLWIADRVMIGNRRLYYYSLSLFPSEAWECNSRIYFPGSAVALSPFRSLLVASVGPGKQVQSFILGVKKEAFLCSQLPGSQASILEYWGPVYRITCWLCRSCKGKGKVTAFRNAHSFILRLLPTFFTWIPELRFFVDPRMWYEVFATIRRQFRVS